ncbi:MAG: cation:proton antiporter [Chloroflexi bacterium]|nr:cation:proton antiporter [Chloroflexota bacterium]
MTLVDLIVYIIMPLLSLALVFAFYRVLKGPTIADRVVAVDLITTIGLALIVCFAMIAEQTLFIDVAMVVALTGFLGTIAFAYYIEQQKG